MHVEYALFLDIDRNNIAKEFHTKDKEVALTTKLETSGDCYLTYEKTKHLRVNWETTPQGKIKVDCSIFDGRDSENFKGEVQKTDSYVVAPFKKKTLVIRIVSWDK
jgi:hypothetical protein